jgi:hypothetical protein
MQSASTRQRVFVGVHLDEATVRELDQLALDRQPPNSRKLGRATIIRNAVAQFLRNRNVTQDGMAR